MTKYEWKPGDIADINGSRAMRNKRNDGWVWFDGVRSSDSLTAPGARPLAVIDPEDREQVARLEAIYDKALREAAKYDGTEDVLQAALREFAADPKPEEPTGLGAVVLDSDGNQWVRVPDPAHPWVRAHREEGSYGHRTYWTRVDAVRVLSEGVTE